MLKNKPYLLIIIALIILGLVILVPTIWGRLSLASAPKTRVEILQVPAGSTPTATAFQPQASTPTYNPTDYPTSTPTATPKPEKIKPSSNTSGVDPIPQPEGQINIMLLGSDMKYTGYVGRTDTIILLTVNPDEGTVSMTSFPRDLYVFIPGWTDQRINTAFGHGGFPLLQKTMEHNFGVKPDYFILVNLWAFEYIIDHLGGIYVNVPRTLCDDNWGHGLSHCVYPGNQLFYGQEALWYVRSRMTTNDFDRNYRQQLVLRAMLDRLISLGSIGKIPQLYETYQKNVTTNLDLETITSLSPIALHLSDSTLINQYYINQDAITEWVTPGGAQVLLPNYTVIRKILKKALNAP
jgi:LCP family protein required for cell wall assembly